MECTFEEMEEILKNLDWFNSLNFESQKKVIQYFIKNDSEFYFIQYYFVEYSNDLYLLSDLYKDTIGIRIENLHVIHYGDFDMEFKYLYLYRIWHEKTEQYEVRD